MDFATREHAETTLGRIAAEQHIHIGAIKPHRIKTHPAFKVNIGQQINLPLLTPLPLLRFVRMDSESLVLRCVSTTEVLQQILEMMHY